MGPDPWILVYHQYSIDSASTGNKHIPIEIYFFVFDVFKHHKCFFRWKFNKQTWIGTDLKYTIIGPYDASKLWLVYISSIWSLWIPMPENVSSLKVMMCVDTRCSRGRRSRLHEYKTHLSHHILSKRYLQLFTVICSCIL